LDGHLGRAEQEVRGVLGTLETVSEEVAQLLQGLEELAAARAWLAQAADALGIVREEAAAEAHRRSDTWESLASLTRADVGNA
jgi:hypothetical protein